MCFKLLEPAALCESHALQLFAFAKCAYPNLSHAGWHHNPLDVSTVEPVIPDSLSTLWDDDVLLLPKVSDTHTSDDSIRQWAYLRGVWNFSKRKVRTAAVLDVNYLEALTSAEGVP